jgi:uncharacterized protein YodC (DUF2158 family)
MAKDFKQGDVVMFVIGGPKMLEKRFTNPGGESIPEVVCQWFTPAGEFREASFLPESLVEAGDHVFKES